ncbi:hypothetical protein THAOC_13365 [Thalassiosira oceanica]|uniref:Glutaredoxin 2 C-terminal domain-containing protein n=1 Tax=Thalassiosira oceanica TaxID=159749 RepID=K0SHY3_THAOC|nr:hypothetical protein THAOC_13365 [Thalassiosira oceanica]|eukprot:EJK65748.1 hypothetical protein THAOC_13365 [Thalassiosira oceanica]
MPESETADDSALEYTPPLSPWCTSGQYWPSSHGPVYRASSRWVSCFTAFVTRGRPRQGLCLLALATIVSTYVPSVGFRTSHMSDFRKPKAKKNGPLISNRYKLSRVHAVLVGISPDADACPAYPLPAFTAHRLLSIAAAGALPEDCEGEGYDGKLNPRTLTGKKQLPVLQGDGVPTAPGAIGMPESLEICSFLIGRHGLSVPCATGRADVDAFVRSLLDKNVMNPLTLTRLTKMPVPDWDDPRDVSYHLWKHAKKGDLCAFESPREDARAIVALNEKLQELPALMLGDGCLNPWGWGMDDVILLPWLRRLTCIKGIEFPKGVETYMSAVGAQVVNYAQHAV